MSKPRVAFLIGQSLISQLFEEKVIQQIEALTEPRYAACEGAPGAGEAAQLLQGAQIAVCSWGSPRFDAALLERAPELRKVIYAAGSVKPIVTPELAARGIVVTSGAAVIARNVAEATLGYIIVGLKNGWRIAAEVRRGNWRRTPERERVRELFGLTVGVVGAGQVGRAVLELLVHFDVERLVYDPFITQEQAGAYGARKVTLEELLRSSDVITLHAPALPATRHMLNEQTIPMIKPGALLVNTARGQLIDEKALLARLRQGDIAAVLDVTDPEPPPADHPFFALDNVVITPHIAGGVSNGRLRLGRYVLAELQADVQGAAPLHPVDLAQLDVLA